jgi:hypothetical protein
VNSGTIFGRPDFGNPEANAFMDQILRGLEDWLLLDYASTDGHVLTYDSTVARRVKWGPAGGSLELGDLTDVDLTGIADGDILYYDSAGPGYYFDAPPSGSGGGSKLCLCRSVTSTGDTGAPQTGGSGYVDVPFGTEIVAATAEVEVTSDEEYTIKTAGTYKIEVDAGFNAASYGNVEVRIEVNGTDVKRMVLGVAYVNVVVSGHMHISMEFAVDDVIVVKCSSTSGNDIYIRGTSGGINESLLTITKEG